MQAAYRACRGLQETGADLLLVADDEALETLREHIQNEPLSIMKRRDPPLLENFDSSRRAD